MDIVYQLGYKLPGHNNTSFFNSQSKELAMTKIHNILFKKISDGTLTIKQSHEVLGTVEVVRFEIPLI